MKLLLFSLDLFIDPAVPAAVLSCQLGLGSVNSLHCYSSSHRWYMLTTCCCPLLLASALLGSSHLGRFTHLSTLLATCCLGWLVWCVPLVLPEAFRQCN